MKGQKMDGSIQVYYGNGRGKTTAALGLGIRAAGVGKQVIMVQFLKKKHSDTLDFLKKLEPELQIFRFEKAACGYSDLSPKEKQEQMLNIKNALGYSRKVLDTGQCDLLILDDLGTEMPGQFVTAALYTLVNDRLMEGKPMIISTNLNIGEVAQRYNPQIASRLEGEYRELTFVGQDIRLLRKNS